jgi:hypothetical protein
MLQVASLAIAFRTSRGHSFLYQRSTQHIFFRRALANKPENASLAHAEALFRRNRKIAG